MFVLVLALSPLNALLSTQGVAGILSKQGPLSDAGFGRWSRVGIERLDSVEDFVRGLVVEERIIGVLRQISHVSIPPFLFYSCGFLRSFSLYLICLVSFLLFSLYLVLPFLLVFIRPLSFGISRRLACAAGYSIVSIPLPSFHVKEGRDWDQAEEYGKGKAWPIVGVSVKKYLSGHCYMLVCGLFVALIMSVDG
jgi:hypothetical protein